MPIRVAVKVTAAALAALCCSVAPAHALLACGGLFSSAVTVNATSLNFGNYTPASPDYASAQVTVQCGALGLDLLPAFTVSLTAFNGSSPAARYMNMGASRLGYNVYTTSSYGTVWGDGTAGSVTQSYGALITLGTIGFTAWGRVTSGQYVAAGSYGDRITVTVSY